MSNHRKRCFSYSVFVLIQVFAEIAVLIVYLNYREKSVCKLFWLPEFFGSLTHIVELAKTSLPFVQDKFWNAFIVNRVHLV